MFVQCIANAAFAMFGIKMKNLCNSIKILYFFQWFICLHRWSITRRIDIMLVVHFLTQLRWSVAIMRFNTYHIRHRFVKNFMFNHLLQKISIPILFFLSLKQYWFDLSLLRHSANRANQYQWCFWAFCSLKNVTRYQNICLFSWSSSG